MLRLQASDVKLGGVVDPESALAKQRFCTQSGTTSCATATAPSNEPGLSLLYKRYPDCIITTSGISFSEF